MKVRKASLGLAAAVSLGAVALATPVASAAEISTTLTIDDQMCTATTQLTEEDQQELVEMAEESRREIADYLKERLPDAAEAIDTLAEPVTGQTTTPEVREEARAAVNTAATAAGIPDPDRVVLIQLLEYGHLLSPAFIEDAQPRDLPRDDALAADRDHLLTWDGLLFEATAGEDGAEQIEFQPATVTAVNQAFDWFQDLVDGEVELLTACIDGEPGTFTTTIGENTGDDDPVDPGRIPAEGRDGLSSGSSLGSSR